LAFCPLVYSWSYFYLRQPPKQAGCVAAAQAITSNTYLKTRSLVMIGNRWHYSAFMASLPAFVFKVSHRRRLYTASKTTVCPA
jgi:hypothetical protein